MIGAVWLAFLVAAPPFTLPLRTDERSNSFMSHSAALQSCSHATGNGCLSSPVASVCRAGSLQRDHAAALVIPVHVAQSVDSALLQARCCHSSQLQPLFFIAENSDRQGSAAALAVRMQCVLQCTKRCFHF